MSGGYTHRANSRCTICGNAKIRRRVNELLDEKKTMSSIAQEFGLSPTTLFRHKHKCHDPSTKVLQALIDDEKPEDDPASSPRTTRVRTSSMTPEEIIEAATVLFRRGEKIFDAALLTGNVRDCLAGLEVVRRSLELCAKLAGMMSNGPATVIDQRSIVFKNMDALSVEELRALAYGGPTTTIVASIAAPPDDAPPDDDENIPDEPDATPDAPSTTVTPAAAVEVAAPSPPPPATSAKTAPSGPRPLWAYGVRGIDYRLPFARHFKSESRFQAWLRKHGDAVRVESYEYD